MFEFWRRFAFDGPPFVHPDDRDHLRRQLERATLFRDYESFIHSSEFGPPERNTLEFSLYPNPYAGDLISAEIVVLMLNPGLEIGDFAVELTSTPFREAAHDSIVQDLANRQFKFLYLDPALAMHPGFRWWEQRLRPIVNRISHETALSYGGALRLLAAKLASIELVPYHSAGLSINGGLSKLPSLQHACELVRELGHNPNVTWLVTRQAKRWSQVLPQDARVVHGEMPRGVSFSPTSKFGEAILRKIGLLNQTPPQLRAALRPIVDRLVTRLDPEAIYLFGSHARNEAGPDSDFDLMVTLPDDAPAEQADPRRPHEALRGIGIATDVLVWHRRHFESRLHIRSSLPATIADEGRVLYAKQSLATDEEPDVHAA